MVLILSIICMRFIPNLSRLSLTASKTLPKSHPASYRALNINTNPRTGMAIARKGAAAAITDPAKAKSPPLAININPFWIINRPFLAISNPCVIIILPCNSNTVVPKAAMIGTRLSKIYPATLIKGFST